MRRKRERETEEGNVGCENGAEQTHPNVEVDAGIVRDLLLRVDVLGDVHGDPVATHVRDEKEAIQNDFAAIEVVYSFICFLIRCIPVTWGRREVRLDQLSKRNLLRSSMK